MNTSAFCAPYAPLILRSSTSPPPSTLNPRRLSFVARRLHPLRVSMSAQSAAAAAASASASAEGHDELTVSAASHSYPIVFRPHGLRDASLFAPHAPGDKVLIVTNDTVGPLYLDRVAQTLKEAGKTVFTVVLPDGEQHKSIECLGTIWDACLRHRLDRKSTLIALGGGVVGDITGFAAATYVRGVPFIQVPTTLLAVVDSAVGGKTAINHPGGKNMIGAFYQPNTVIVDRTVLETLDDRQMAAGIAEIVKYGLIRDWPFFEWCEDNMDALRARDPDALQYAMRMSCQFKADVVAEDERESGVRAILNLGHTFGHAIEASMGYGAWLHGEAVAAGMVMACEMSCRLGWIEEDVTRRVEAVLARASLPVRPPAAVTLEKFMTYMSVDKKVEAGVLRLILLKAPGHAVITSDYPEDVLFDTIMYYHALFKKDPGHYHRNFPPSS